MAKKELGPRLLLLTEHTFPNDSPPGGEVGVEENASLGCLVHDFLHMAVIDIGMTGEQISLFCMAVERMMHLCRSQKDFTVELAERAVQEEIDLRERVAGIEFSGLARVPRHKMN